LLLLFCGRHKQFGKMGKSVEHETYVRRKYLLFLFQRIIPLQSDLQNQI